MVYLTKFCVTKLYVTKVCVCVCVGVCDKVVYDKGVSDQVVCVCDKVVCDQGVCVCVREYV